MKIQHFFDSFHEINDEKREQFDSVFFAKFTNVFFFGGGSAEEDLTELVRRQVGHNAPNQWRLKKSDARDPQLPCFSPSDPPLTTRLP